MTSTWRGYHRGDLIKTTKFGDAPFQYHTYNPNNGEEWVTIYLSAGGFRSVFVRDVISEEKPVIARRRRRRKVSP